MALYKCVLGGQGSGENPYIFIDGLNINEYPVMSLDNVFHNDTIFNSRITIGETVTNCYRMFYNCYSYNQPTIFPFNVHYISSAFGRCNSFNSSVIVYNDRPYVEGMFVGCTSFNSPVYFNNYITRGDGLFQGSGFNLPIILTTSPQYSGSDMFNDSFRNTQHDYPVVFRPRKCLDRTSRFSNAFENVPNRKSDIIIDLSLASGNNYNVRNMLTGHNSSIRINIYSQDLSSLIETTAYYSVTGTDITWSSTTNGYYNSSYNIYLLNNVGNALNKFNTSYKSVYGVNPTYPI